MPNAPAPARATLIVMRAPSRFLQDQVADRGVAGRHVVEAVRDGRRRRRRRGRPSRRGRSATSPARCLRSRPRARSRCAACSARPSGSAIRWSRNALSNSLLISPARGPCSWWLMPPVPQICTFERLVVGLDRAADRLAELEAASARRHRVLHHVDGERDHRARPGVGLAEHQRQRHREAVVDVHLVDDRQVEVLLDHRLGDVRGQLGMADRRRAPAAGPSPRRRLRTRRAVPIANVGIMSRLNAVAWSL